MRPVPLLLAAGCLVAALAAPAVAQPPGPWVSPLGEPPRVVRAFQPPVVRWGAGHRGVDLAGSRYAWVRAAGGGHVSFAGSLAGRGVVVVVHGDLRTTYEPVTPAVRVGERVAAGTRIGRLMPGHDAGRREAAILHWGLLRGDTYLDPMSLIGRRPVRLLPRWRGSPPGGVATDPAAHRAPVGLAAAHRTPVGLAAAPERPGPSAGRAAAALAALAVAGAAAVLARARPAP
jgi:hypothetical protein